MKVQLVLVNDALNALGHGGAHHGLRLQAIAEEMPIVHKHDAIGGHAWATLVEGVRQGQPACRH